MEASSDVVIEKQRGLVAHRSFNHQIVVIGKKGSGKSEWALGVCLAFARLPCYVFAHDLGWKIPDTLHDGRKTYAIRVHTAAEARKLVGEGRNGIFSISCEDAQEVYELACEVAEASLQKHGGSEGHPAIFYADEIVSAGIMDPHHMEPGFKRLMAEARHRHVGIIVGVQSARMLHNTLLTLATHVQLFSISDRRDHRRLVECGLDEATVARTATLPPHESFGVKL